MRERIAKSVFWIVWSKGGLQLLSLFSTMMLARLLNPSDYGLMALAGIWTTTMAMLAELGLGGAVVQFPALKKGELNACFWVAVSAAAVGYLSLFAAAPYIGAWFRTPALVSILRVAGLSLPLLALRTIPDSLLRKGLDFDKLSKAEVSASLVATSTVLLLAWSGAGVWALVLGGLIQAAVGTVIVFRFVRWWPSFKLESERLPEIVRFSMASLGARVSWSLYDQIDAFVLGKHSGGQVLGFYSMARFLSTLPVERVSVLVNSVAIPVMAESQHDVVAMQRYFLRGIRLIACLTFPLCIGLALVADDAVRVILSDKWLPALPLLRTLCAYAVVHSLAVLFPPVLFARYRAGYVMRWTVALILIMPFAFWGGAAWLGGLGVALAWVFCYPIFVIFLARETLNELDITWEVAWRQLRPVVSAIVAMVTSVALIEIYMPADTVATRILRLFVAISVGTGIYSSWLLWRKAPVVTEMLEVIRWVTGRVPALSQRS